MTQKGSLLEDHIEAGQDGRHFGRPSSASAFPLMKIFEF